MIKFFTSIGIALLSLVGLLLISVIWLFLSTPQPSDIKGCLTTALYQVRLCPTESGYVPLSEIAASAKNALLVSEDSTFYDHHGIDWFELRRSAEKNWEKNEFARGGSTITQQLAKNVYLSKEKSILRKIREVIITVQLEKTLTKDEILEKYLNVVEFGPGLFGIGKAAKFYFGKSPANLTPAESVFLAFLLPNPKLYSQSFRAKRLTKYAFTRMRILVDRLYRFKKISAQEHESAISQVNHFYGSLSEYAKDKVDESTIPPEENAEGADDVGPDGATLNHMERDLDRGASTPDDEESEESIARPPEE